MRGPGGYRERLGGRRRGRNGRASTSTCSRPLASSWSHASKSLP